MSANSIQQHDPKPLLFPEQVTDNQVFRVIIGKDTEALIVSYLDPKSLAISRRVCNTWNTDSAIQNAMMCIVDKNERGYRADILATFQGAGYRLGKTPLLKQEMRFDYPHVDPDLMTASVMRYMSNNRPGIALLIQNRKSLDVAVVPLNRRSINSDLWVATAIQFQHLIDAVRHNQHDIEPTDHPIVRLTNFDISNPAMIEFVRGLITNTDPQLQLVAPSKEIVERFASQKQQHNRQLLELMVDDEYDGAPPPRRHTPSYCSQHTPYLTVTALVIGAVACSVFLA